MTLNCAKCHDHKYDPLVQTDYYRARAIFEPHSVRIDRVPRQLDVVQNGITRVYDADLTAETFLYVQGNEQNPDKSRAMEASLPAFFGDELTAEPIELALLADVPDLREFVLKGTLAAARTELEQAEARLPTRSVPCSNSNSRRPRPRSLRRKSASPRIARVIPILPVRRMTNCAARPHRRSGCMLPQRLRSP